MRVKLGVIVCVLLVCFAVQLNAKQGAENPHKSEVASTGVITGTLFDADKKPLGGHKVILEIFHEQNPVLAIPKNTTAKGGYRFKNIFQRSDFSYVITTNYQGAVYRTSAVTLKPGEQKRTVDLTIGTRAKAQAGPPAQPSHPGHVVAKKRGWPFDIYQTVAILLSLAAIVYVIFVLRRKPKDRG